ncbi:MAG: PAS domain S-box protein [Bacteroidetes bacterium]|nr:PAS domain S-box protein [Bacteroidota bacterium]
MADTQTSLNYYFIAQKLIERFNNPILESKVNRALGDVYLSVKSYEKATKYYLKVITTNNRVDINFGNNTGAVYTLLAYIAQINGNYDTALHYNKMALEWRKDHKQVDQYISSLLNIGNSYLDLNQYDSTLYYLKSGLDLAIQNKIYQLIEYGYQNLYKFYQVKHDWKNAIICFKKFTEAKDSVQAVNYRYNITLFETNQALSETEKKNENLKVENDIQRLNLKIKTIQIIVLLGFVFLSLIITVLVYRLYIKNKKSRIALKSINSQLDAEVEDRKKIAEQLRESESLHRFLTEHSMDLISRMDNRFHFTYVSPSCRNIYGFEPSELLSVTNQAEIIHPDFRDSLLREYSEMIRRKEPVKFRYRTKGKDGNYFWVESHVNPIFDEMTGELLESIAVIRDITERVDQEDAIRENAKQKELLIREIHHRSKNNMGVLISIISMQKNKTRNKELLDNLTDLQSRVRTMTLVHDQLYRSRNIVTLSFREYLENLTSTISMAFSGDNIVLHTDIHESYFDVEVSLTLGLILNELLTNAFKYAFPDHQQGNIRIDFHPLPSRQKKGEYKEMKWILSVKDDGTGLPPDFDLETTSSLGMQIITTLSEQLHGKIKAEGKDGTRFSIYLPELTNQKEKE